MGDPTKKMPSDTDGSKVGLYSKETALFDNIHCLKPVLCCYV